MISGRPVCEAHNYIQGFQSCTVKYGGWEVQQHFTYQKCCLLLCKQWCQLDEWTIKSSSAFHTLQCASIQVIIIFLESKNEKWVIGFQCYCASLFRTTMSSASRQTKSFKLWSKPQTCLEINMCGPVGLSVSSYQYITSAESSCSSCLRLFVTSGQLRFNLHPSQFIIRKHITWRDATLWTFMCCSHSLCSSVSGVPPDVQPAAQEHQWRRALTPGDQVTLTVRDPGRLWGDGWGGGQCSVHQTGKNIWFMFSKYLQSYFGH